MRADRGTAEDGGTPIAGSERNSKRDSDANPSFLGRLARFRHGIGASAFSRSPFQFSRSAVQAGVFVMLTVLTQVGGVLCLAAWWISGRWCRRKRARAACAAGAYLLATLFFIPLLARPLGRVPLPLVHTESLPLAPRTAWFWLANRHYVTPDVRDVLAGAARKLQATHPHSVVHYLDAGFPFRDGLAMIPHWSHGSGRAVDLTFCYKRNRGGAYGASPSPIGYGIYEGPGPGEAQPYRGKFSWLRWDLPWLQWFNRRNRLDENRTRDLVRFLLEDPRTNKVLLELHLQHRLGLQHGKLRFQQLQAARHDDHLHVVVR